LDFVNHNRRNLPQLFAEEAGGQKAAQNAALGNPMSISVQSSTAAQIALENLLGANGAGAAIQSGAPEQSLAEAPADAAQPAAVWDIGGAGAGTNASDGLATAASIADSAVSAGGAITDILERMRQAAISASDPNLDQGARSALDASYQAELGQLQSVVGQASTSGINLIDGSLSGNVQAPSDGTDTATLTATDLTATGPVIGLPANSSLLDPSAAASVADTLQTAIGAVGQALGQIAAQGDAIQSHLDLLAQAAWSSSGSGGSAVAPGVDQDGARLQALQVQQQLAASGYAISSPGSLGILGLFK
jgi:flagellin